jgi:hypothetical protein
MIIYAFAGGPKRTKYMQFTSFFGENRTLAFILAAVCLLIGVALLFVLFRIVFGRGIKLPGGRGRQQRLGLVDAFEIDRQRQLVIVRRDNVEHLIMIGGPNDVVVESTIIRAEAREARSSREREQPAISGLSWPAGPAATEIAAQTPAEPAPAAARPTVPEPPPPPRPQPAPPAPRPAPAAGEAPAAEATGEAEQSALTPPPPRPLRPPLPPLRPLGTGERSTLPPRPPLTPLRREPRPLPPFLTSPKPAEPAPAPASPPPEPAAESVATAATDLSGETGVPPPPAPDHPAAEQQASSPAAEAQPGAAPKIELDPLASLEEEMAKLLGRNPNEGH